MPEILIRPLEAADLADAAALLVSLNPETPAETVVQRLQTILAEHSHYRLVGAFDGSTLTGVAGAWLATKIWCGLYLEIDNLVVSESHRSRGIGSRLIADLEAHARERGAEVMVLDSYTSNHSSHRLYHRLGFEIWGFHFVKPLGDLKSGH